MLHAGFLSATGELFDSFFSPRTQRQRHCRSSNCVIMTPSRAQIVTCEFGLCLCLILSLPSRGPSAVTQLLDVSAQFRHASQHVLEKIRQLRLIFSRPQLLASRSCRFSVVRCDGVTNVVEVSSHPDTCQIVTSSHSLTSG